MIIIDQEKNNLVNFENIVSIGISDYEGLQRITAETLGHAVVLGDYKTEERAKKVLEEIAKIIGVKKVENVSYEYVDIAIKIKRNGIYEMPKE